MDQAQKIVAFRDSVRPDMALVAHTLDGMFEALGIVMKRTLTGPDCWMWEEERGSGRVFCLAGSALPDVVGYPLLTIRRSIAPRLDASTSMSMLVMANTPEQIHVVMTHLILQFAGLNAGLDLITKFLVVEDMPSVIERVEQISALFTESMERQSQKISDSVFTDGKNLN